MARGGVSRGQCMKGGGVTWAMYEGGVTWAMYSGGVTWSMYTFLTPAYMRVSRGQCMRGSRDYVRIIV